jgi:hypothetical protein
VSLRALGRRLLAGWTAIAAHFGEVQTLVILGFFYAVVIGPVSAVARAARVDFLAKRTLREPGSAWQPADSAKPDLERAKLAS